MKEYRYRGIFIGAYSSLEIMETTSVSYQWYQPLISVVSCIEPN